MRIPRQLPRFVHAPALFIVAGLKVGRCARVADGVWMPLAEVELPKPQYSDDERRTKRRGSRAGQQVEYGSVPEIRSQLRRAEFLRLLLPMIRKAAAEAVYDVVYLFAPPAMLGDLRAGLPVTLRKKVARAIRGNYLDAHPHELLRMIIPKSRKEPEPPAVQALLAPHVPDAA